MVRIYLGGQIIQPTPADMERCQRRFYSARLHNLTFQHQSTTIRGVLQFSF